MARSTLVKPGSKVVLGKVEAGYSGGLEKDDPEVGRKLGADLVSMAQWQEKLYAEGKQSLLIVLQAMDAGGKDGTLRHVMDGFNPQSCRVVSFKQPSAEELAHDFLWRIHQQVPRKGEIVVFNRSHYEDVLVVRVHKLVPDEVIQARFEVINVFEKYLAAAGTRVVKFFLHISKDEQKERLEERLRNPDKIWKFQPGDLEERERWDEYMHAFEDVLSKCSTAGAPWHIIPANAKWYRNMVVADIIEKTLRGMKPEYPKAAVDASEYVIR
jgi:PPK2 family polyphosphate:nucleotide phosphotransferase